MVNYQVTVFLDRLLSNGLAILGANYTYYYIHTVCVQVAITQIRPVHMHRQNIFLLFIYSMSGNFSQAGSIVFRFSGI